MCPLRGKKKLNLKIQRFGSPYATLHLLKRSLSLNILLDNQETFFYDTKYKNSRQKGEGKGESFYIPYGLVAKIC